MIRNGEEEMIMKEVFFVSFKVFYQHSKGRGLRKIMKNIRQDGINHPKYRS